MALFVCESTAEKISSGICDAWIEVTGLTLGQSYTPTSLGQIDAELAGVSFLFGISVVWTVIPVAYGVGAMVRILKSA